MFEPLDRGQGYLEVRTEKGVFHLTYNGDRTQWNVLEDSEHRTFTTQGEAFDCVRDIVANR